MYMLLLHVCTMYQSQNLMVATQISDDDIVIIFFKFKTSTCMAGFIKKRVLTPYLTPYSKLLVGVLTSLLKIHIARLSNTY